MVEVKNITCLKTHASGLAKRLADLTLIQEHAASDFEAARFKADFRSQHRRTLALSPPDRNHSKASGGVGAIAQTDDTLFVLDPISKSFKEACDSGRAMLVAYGKGKGGDLAHFYILYGLDMHHRPKLQALRNWSRLLLTKSMPGHWEPPFSWAMSTRTCLTSQRCSI